MRNPVNGRVWDAVWLLVLGIYLFIGAALVPFHPDETEHIRMSKDFETLFVNGNAAQIMDVIDPATGQFRDKEATLRMIDAPLHGYAMGFAWRLAGLTSDYVPPFWDWGLDYQTNASAGARPSAEMLNATRIVTTLVLFFSVIVVFAFGWLINGRWTAYLVSLLYILNPAILLHGRRSMHEAPLLFLGTLTLLIAALIAQQIERGRSVSAIWWVGLVIVSGLTIAGKHTGLFLVGAALAWIFLAEILRAPKDAGSLVRSGARLALIGVLAVAIFVMLTPALWSNPIVMLQRLANERTIQINIQVANMPNALDTLPERLEVMVTHPFTHRDTSAFDLGEGNRYFPSLLAGQPFDNLLGWALTLMVGLGIVVAVRRIWQPNLMSRTLYAGLLIWFLVLVLVLFTNPLPWQRYYVPLIPVETLLIGVAAHSLWNALKERVSSHVETPA